jgi:hypothetical protein
MEIDKIKEYIKNNIGNDKNLVLFKIDKRLSDKNTDCGIYESKKINDEYINNLKKTYSEKDIKIVTYIKNRFRNLIYEVGQIEKFYSEDNTLILITDKYILLENFTKNIKENMIPVLKTYDLSEKILEIHLNTNFGIVIINNLSVKFNTKNISENDINQLFELTNLLT